MTGTINSIIQVGISANGQQGYWGTIAVPIQVSNGIVGNNLSRGGSITQTITINSTITGSMTAYTGTINKIVPITMEADGIIATDLAEINSTIGVVPDITGIVYPSGSINASITIYPNISQSQSGVLVNKSVVSVAAGQVRDSVVLNKAMVHAIVNTGPNILMNKAVVYAVVVGEVIDTTDGYDAITFW